MSAVAQWRDASPGVGDIIAFNRDATPVAAPADPILVFSANQKPCILDTATIHRFGGSFLISAKPDGVAGDFVTHWAGTHTARGAGDCGAGADLVLNRKQIDLLAAAAAVAPTHPANAASGL